MADDVIYIDIAPNTTPHYALSPVPFVYVDYDHADQPIGLSASGPAVIGAQEALDQWLATAPAQRGELAAALIAHPALSALLAE